MNCCHHLISHAWIVLMAIVAVGRTLAFSPYVVDAHTLHLWHLDEASPPFKDASALPKPLLGLINGAQAGQASLPGLEKSVSFNHAVGGEARTKFYRGATLLAQPKSADGPQDNVKPPFPIAGPDGAFSFEALVKFDVLPADAPGLALDIISMDGEAEDRVFNFRIEKSGFLSFIPFSGALVRGGGLATIPTTGPNAINTRDWFHVAVCYDGNEGSSNNLKFYWTRVTTGLERANLLGNGTLAADLGDSLGDFTIGNTGRTQGSKGACNPFPGLIDEVRISSRARAPDEFFFIDQEMRARAARAAGSAMARQREFKLELQRVLVDGKAVEFSRRSRSLIIGPGAHRLDIDFGLAPGVVREAPEVRCLLEGADDFWHPAARGMLLVCEVLDADDVVLSRAAFPRIGRSAGWEGNLTDSQLTSRLEPLFIPGAAKSLRITLSSGTPDITGQSLIDNLSVNRSSHPDPAQSLWKNGGFNTGTLIDTIGGVPDGWKRSGDDPAIALLVQRPVGQAIGLVDGDQEATAEWTSTLRLPAVPASGDVLLLSWQEAYNVIGGRSHRATYLNVPSGQYRFRAIAVARTSVGSSAQMELPIIVRPAIWDDPWFRPTIASIVVGLIATVILQTYRRRTQARISRVRLQHTLEKDRARIARDMHDDLGTRVSGLIMASSLVQRDFESDPSATRRHLARMGGSARDLAAAMSELVWAVDPANDTLDQLVSHLTGMAQDMFRDSPVRIRIAVPTHLPSIPLRSDFRHHFSLAVKEALHNALKHAGPCDLLLDLQVEDGELIAIIKDRGVGFDATVATAGNGLFNLNSRLADLGGSCQVISKPGAGTTVTLRCAVDKLRHSNSR